MAQQASQTRGGFGKAFAGLLGAGLIITSAFAEWLNGRTAWGISISSLYHETFKNAPTFGIAVGAVLVLLGLVAILGIATNGIVTRIAGALAILLFTGWMIQLYVHHNPGISNLPGIGAWLALIGGLVAATGGGS
jgi:hypothetical protein